MGLAGLASGKIYFSETFGDGWENRWTVSKWKDSEGTAGKWVANAGKWYSDEAEDTGIQTSLDSTFFGISAGFDSFSNAGRSCDGPCSDKAGPAGRYVRPEVGSI